MCSRWARWKVAGPWELDRPRSFWFGDSGASCDLYVGKQSFKAELARDQGKAARSKLLDLVQAYEHVPHHVLAAAARRYNFSGKTSRFLLATYSLDRM
eukprot:5665102-Pyramimonas_sp.AAC.1